MVRETYDFDVTLKGLLDILKDNLNEALGNNDYEANLEWLANYPVKVKQKLRNSREFKMPKTPARKKTRQQTKRFLNEDDEQASGDHNAVPSKKGKLSPEEDEFQEILGGRPRRQASLVAKSKIQQSLKMANDLRQKMRRPKADQSDADSNVSSIQDSSSVQDSDFNNQRFEMKNGSPDLCEPKSKNKANNQKMFVKSKDTSPPLSANSTFSKGEAKCPPPTMLKVNFASEPTAISPPPEISETFVVPDEPVEQEILSPIKPVPVIPAFVEEVPCVPKKRGRPRIVAKKIDSGSENEKIVPDKKVEKQIIEDSLPLEEPKEIKRPSSELNVVSDPDALLKKKVRKARKPVEESSSPAVVAPTAGAPSLRRNRNQGTSVRSSAVVVSNSPRIVKTPSKLHEQIQRNANNQFNPTNSSPVKRVFTPKLVFSPFKSTSVKTKVEAFEAALGSGGPGTPTTNNTNSSAKPKTYALPEVRVLLQRLTSQQLKEAAGAVKPQRASRKPKEKEAKRCTFVLENSDSEKENKSTRQSMAQILARKSLDKAKHIVVAAARNKLLASTTQNEATESPNVHVNRNAATLMSKFRFATASGSSGSSSSSLNRCVTMTHGKSASNIVTGIGTFTGTKPVGAMPTKATEEDGLKRKELELKRLKEKEEEAARKREEYLKAKAEEQKRKHEARAKRALAQRTLITKQHTEEQKQKLENKEEKSAHLKQKIQAENQEKAERVRIALLQRQQEAEQRRKAEELQKQQEWEEEQLRLQAVKKEQEEQEKQAKLRHAEVEKAKAAAAAAVAVAVPPVPAGPSTLNTTVTLPSSLSANYQITPVRVTKKGKLFNPDNYDIGDMRSDDSTDDDSRPKKSIPTWARSFNIKVALAQQSEANIDTDQLFPGDKLLKDPNLNDIFKIKRARFNKRTSSAVWKTPPSNYM